MMRTEVKIGISVAVLLVVVVVGYVVINRSEDPAPAGNPSANRTGNASGLTYAEPANGTNRSANSSWPTNRAANNAGNQTSIFGGGYSLNTANNAANNATTVGWGAYNTPSNAGYNTANAASNGGSFTTVYNAAGNSASDWDDFDSAWTSNVASNSASNQAGGTTGGTGGFDTAVSSGETRTYTVKSGDSGFWGIAAKPEVYGDGKFYTLLEEANKNVDSRRLAVGTVLKVPPLPKTGPVAAGGPGGASVAADGSKVYVVVDGDTLTKIARQTLGSGSQANVDALLKANPGLTANIKPGQKITLPDVVAVTPGTGTGSTTRAASNRPANTSSDGAPRPTFNR